MSKPINSYSKDFKLMVLGQIISIQGAALLRFALSLYVLDLTGRADMFAALFAVSNIPILLSPLGGALADRFNRRNLMVIFDFTSSFIVFGLFLLMTAKLSSIPLIGFIMILLAIVSTLYMPTVTASIPLLVPSEKLESANGMVQGVQALSGVIAPILGGALYGAIGMLNLIIISSIAFFLSAVMEIFIKIPFTKRPVEGAMAVVILKDMKQGFRYVVKQSFILKSMIAAAVLNLLMSPLLIVGAPIILRFTMKSNNTLYGIGMGLISLASIGGAMSIGFFAGKIKMNTMYRFIGLIALMLIPCALAVLPAVLELGYYPSFLLFILGSIAMSMLSTVMSIYLITKVQRVTPNENLGRVMAIILAVAQCAAPLGQIIYGMVFESFSTMLYLPLFGLCLIMILVTVGCQQMFRREID